MMEDQLRELNESSVRGRATIGPAFSTTFDLVRQYGHSFTRQALPKRRWTKGLGQCYRNALQAAKTRRYIYVEGYAISEGSSGLLRHHAWVTDLVNPTVAFDPTWRCGLEYFGIPFKLDYVLTMLDASGHPGVLDDWEMKFPLESGVCRIEEAIWRPEP
jgi:hypothetical protein